MPLNVVNDRDGSSRILLTDPAGSTAEVLLLPLFSSSYSIFGSSEISPCEKLDFAHTIMDFEKIWCLSLSVITTLSLNVGVFTTFVVWIRKGLAWWHGMCYFSRKLCKRLSSYIFFFCAGNCFRCFCMEDKWFLGEMKGESSCFIWAARLTLTCW